MSLDAFHWPHRLQPPLDVMKLVVNCTSMTSDLRKAILWIGQEMKVKMKKKYRSQVPRKREMDRLN